MTEVGIGSLTLTLREGESLSVELPDGQSVTVFLSRVESGGRASLNIRAPRQLPVVRHTRVSPRMR
jgi:hypothetical protein